MTPLAIHTETEVCAPCHARRSPLGDGHEIGKPLLDGYRPLAARSRPLPRQRPDGRRGLQLRLVPAEQDVRGRGHLLELPRAAQPEAARRGQRGLRPVPSAQRVRHGRPPLSHARRARQPVRRLPHAGQDLHGGRPAPRSRLPRAAPGPRHQDRRRRMSAPAAMRTRIPRGPRRGSRSGTARTDGASQRSARRWRPTGPPCRARRSVW